MSKMGAYLLELEEDFERLTTTSMQWNKATWNEQCQDGRFTITESDWAFKYIYWFDDNYAAVVQAKTILEELGETFRVVLDDFTGEWTIITTHQSIAWRG